MRRLIVMLVILLGLVAGAQAQGGGQFCLRAYQDRNGNAVLDAGEPFITAGVSANLLNADNVIIASATLDDSPTAAQGVICFQFLEPGQYTLTVTSADYTPTTADTMTASIAAGTLPTVMEYGAQRIEAQVVPTEPASPVQGLLDDPDLPQRVVISALGALLIMAGMVVLGGFIYLIAFRARREPAPLPESVLQTTYIPDDPVLSGAPTPTPGAMPAVRVDDDAADDDEDREQLL